MNAFELGFFEELDKIAALNPLQRLGVKAQSLLTGFRPTLGSGIYEAKRKLVDKYNNFDEARKKAVKGVSGRNESFTNNDPNSPSQLKDFLNSKDRSTLSYLGSRGGVQSHGGFENSPTYGRESGIDFGEYGSATKQQRNLYDVHGKLKRDYSLGNLKKEMYPHLLNDANNAGIRRRIGWHEDVNKLVPDKHAYEE